MGGTRVLAAISVLAGAGFLAGCCLFSGTPTVAITVSPTPATVGQPVVLTARPDGGKPPYTYEWFGVTGSTKTVTTTFQSAGTYSVSVTVTDSCGKTAEDETVVIVTGESTGGSLTGFWNGYIDFYGDTRACTMQLTQQGTALSGTVYRGQWAMSATGSYIGGIFELRFTWTYTGEEVRLSGGLQGSNIITGDVFNRNVKIGTFRFQR